MAKDRMHKDEGVPPFFRQGMKLGAATAAALLVLSGCKTLETKPAPELFQGYTCCNLHYEGDWISDSNYANLPMIPAGTPVKVLSYGRERAHVDMNGKPYRLGHDYGREQESLEQWVKKLVVPSDPRTRLATFPKQTQDAIKAGRLTKGMTKEQVLMAVGYPLTNENRSLDEPVWRYWWSSFGEYQVEWDKQGRVKDISGHPDTLRLMIHKP